jgi:uncharacterized protein (TIGR02147 family)
MFAKPNHTYLRKVLISELAQRRTRNPAYSTRAFASALKLNSGALSAIINGKRKVSARMALRLAGQLNLDPEQKAKITEKPPTESKEIAETFSYDSVSMDHFRLIAESQFFALLSLAKKTGVKNDLELISRRLGISPSAAKKAIQVVLDLGLVSEKDGRLLRTSKRISTSDGIADPAIRKAHLEDCQLAAKSIEQDAVELRDMSSITFRLDPESLKKIAAIVRQAQDQALQLSESENGEEVYRMSVHIFPLTKFSHSYKET